MNKPEYLMLTGGLIGMVIVSLLNLTFSLQSQATKDRFYSIFIFSATFIFFGSIALLSPVRKILCLVALGLAGFYTMGHRLGLPRACPHCGNNLYSLFNIVKCPHCGQNIRARGHTEAQQSASADAGTHRPRV